MPAGFHPRKNEHGKSVLLAQPGQPTALETWHDPAAVAIVTPDSPMPFCINGVTVCEWATVPDTLAGWAGVTGQGDFSEPAFTLPAGKKAAAGAVIIESDDRIWLVAPSNAFGGYTQTFPKGRVDPGLDMRATAIKEVFEESGLQVVLTGFLADVSRTQSFTRYYMAHRVGGSPAAMGWESQAVLLVPRQQLATYLLHPNDQSLLKALLAMQPAPL